MVRTRTGWGDRVTKMAQRGRGVGAPTCGKRSSPSSKIDRVGVNAGLWGNGRRRCGVSRGSQLPNCDTVSSHRRRNPCPLLQH